MPKLPDFRHLITEAKRRKVFRVASWYLVTAWGASLGAAELFPAFDVSTEVTQLFIIALFLGFPVAVSLAWVYELTSEGLVKDPGTESATPPETDVATGGETLTARSPAAELHVRWKDAQGSPQHQTFSDNFRIGRDENCELQLDDPMISRLHAEMRFTRGRWWLHDAGSRNGTTLNGSLVDKVELPIRGEIEFYEGGPTLLFELKRPGIETLMASKPSSKV